MSPPQRSFCILVILTLLLVAQIDAFAADGAVQTVTENSPTVAQLFSMHILPEPVVPAGKEPTESENVVLKQALNKFQSRGQSDDFSSLEEYLTVNSKSPWRLSVLTNLGLLYYHAGYYSKCIPAYRDAWELGKNATEPKAKALADRAAGEYTKMLARLGRYPELKAFLLENSARDFIGQATELMAAGRGGAAQMEQKPEHAFRCGPMALSRILASQGSPLRDAPPIADARSTMRGMSLAEVAAISRELGMNYQPAKRAPGTQFVLPCVVHWKVGHYAALVKEADGQYLSDDSTFENSTWLTAAALETETSGYFLLPPGPLPAGWSSVSEAEAKQIFGKGTTSGNKPGGTKEGDHHSGGNGPQCKGMATYSFLSMVVSLSITDTPVGYQPPYGMPINFRVTYNHREAGQPSNFNYSNFGSKWTFDWLSYITDSPSNAAVASQAVGGGGTQDFSAYDTNTQSFGVQYETQTVLKRVSASPVKYQLSYPDGSVDVFGQSDGSTSSPRKVFLIQRIDPAGNIVSLGYDSQLRLTRITDATGQVTTLAYGLSGDPYKVTRVTDPFGRHADFAYDASGRLIKVTDVIGIDSQFTYTGTGDFIESLTTPYGTTQFVSSESGRTRRITATDPSGDTEVLEYNENPALQPDSLPSSELPAGMFLRNHVMYARNTYYWDKKAWKEAPGDYTKARLTHWLHTADYTQADTGIESMKSPVEGRVWFNYPGQIQNDEGATLPGTLNNKPSKTGRLFDNGSTQLFQAAYNDIGLPTSTTDPVGRTTLYTYAANKVDLQTVTQQQASGSGLLASYTWNTQHRPLTYTDAAGQATIYTWNAAGQITSVKNAKNETTAFTYYSADAVGKQRKGRLYQIDGALAGSADVVAFDYDATGNVAQVTGPDGYNLGFTYDNLDRLTRVTFPDATYTETTYRFLDPQKTRDRLGRFTTYVYNSLRQLTAVTDPANRTVQYQWCKCGDLQQLIDAMGRITTWKHDVAGRVTAKVYADNSKIVYAYEPLSGRLSFITDEKGQVKTRAYNLDDTLAGLTYTNAEHATPNVSFTYDANYRRLKTMVDGIGTTVYAYNPVAAGTLGAGQLASVDGPLTNDTLTYAYDALGRRTGYAINGVGETRTFDSLGRLFTVTNPLGTFGYTYVGATSRMDKVTYPNGMTCQYNYHPLTGDFRLKDIIHTLPGGSLLSRHSYLYNAVGNITRWTQVSPPAGLNRSWLCGYDDADQLTSVVSQDPDTLAMQPTGQYAYGYDPAGNRKTEIIDGVTNTATFNALNQLTGLVTSGVSTTPQQTYEWDAENRMVAINYTGTNQRSEFQFDGYGRRTRTIEKQGQIVNTDLRSVWRSTEMCELRDGATVKKRYLIRGLQSTDANGSLNGAFTAQNKLGSITSQVSTGSQPIELYDYDPFGRTNVLAGDIAYNYGFARLWSHANSGLQLADFRAYDPNSGRWLSRDPLMERSDLLLYRYVMNNPISNGDPLGWGLFDYGKMCTDMSSKSMQPDGPTDSEVDKFNKDVRQAEKDAGALKWGVDGLDLAKNIGKPPAEASTDIISGQFSQWVAEHWERWF